MSNVLLKARREGSLTVGIETAGASSSISSEVDPSDWSSYSATWALADARRAAIGLESSEVSSSMSSSSTKPSSWLGSRSAAAFVEVVAAAFLAALASSRFRMKSSSFNRFFSSMSWSMRSL